MIAASVLALLVLSPASRVVVVSQAEEEPVPGPVETASDQYRLRLGGLFEGALGKDQFGNAVALPRMRVRAEALVSMQLEVGMVVEADLSPWSSPNLKEDGPGPVRDVFGRMAMGNKKVLDLGEARLGHFTAPILLEHSIPQQDMLFMTGSLGREAWLPGRELNATYEIGAHRYGWPVRGMFSLLSGVKAPVGNAWFTPAPEPHRGADTSAAAAVPLTAGTTYQAVANPGLAGRVEGQPLMRWLRQPWLTVGAGILARPLATGDDARFAAALDGEVKWKVITARAALMAVETQRAPILDGKSVMVEGALEVLPDFLDMRVRYDAAFSGTRVDAHRVSIGSAMFYIDGAPAGPLGNTPGLPMSAAFGRAFTLLWVRTYDLNRYAQGRGPLPPPGDNDARAGWLLGEARWLAAGDVDQLVVRIAF